MKKLLLFSLSGLLFFSCSQEQKQTKLKDQKSEARVLEAKATQTTKGYKIGDKATDFSLVNIDDKKVSLSDFKDVKGYVVIFTCNNCPYAKAYEDRIIALDKAYKGKGFPVIAINPNDPEVSPNDSFAKMKVRAKNKGFTFPYLFDEGQNIFPQYGATRTPHVFLLDNKRIVKYIGAIDDNYQDEASVNTKFLEEAIDAIIEGNNPKTDFTKAIGCTIKVKKS